MKKLTLLFGLGSGVLFASAFQNGGFESPVIGNDFVYTTPTGWTKVDPSCSFICAGLFLEPYANTTANLPTQNKEGSQAFGFGGNQVTEGNLSQTFDTVTGNTYQVSFQYVAQQGGGSPEFQDLELDVLNGANLFATSNPIRFNDIAWVTRTLNFTALSTSTTIRFSDITGASGDSGVFPNWALDAVTVTQLSAAPATPEPSTLALVAFGSLAALWLRRTKSRSS